MIAISDFRLPTSDFRLPTSLFIIHRSNHMDQSIFIWGIVIILGTPALALILIECTGFFERRGSLFAPVLRKIWRYVFPCVAILLVMKQLLKLTGTQLPVKVVETGFWVAVIFTLLSFINAILTTKKPLPGTFQFQVPNIFFQVARISIVLLLFAQVLGNTWQINVGGIVQALGIGSVVVALALQDTFSSVVSGLLLLFDRPFKIGDWIEFDGIKGYVVDQNWRSVTLRHPTWGNTTIVPNGVLAGAKIDNFGQEGVWKSVSVSFSYDDPPNRVLAALTTISLGLDRVNDPNQKLLDPNVKPKIDSFGDSGINYLILFKKMPAPGNIPVVNALMSRIYSMAKRYGFKITHPVSIMYDVDAKDGIPGRIPKQLENRHQEFFTFLRSLPYFASLNPTVVETLAGDVTPKYYAKGEIIIQATEPDEGLYILLEGSVKLFVKDMQGEEKEVNRISIGDCFGEMALMPGELSPVSALAIDDVEVLFIDYRSVQNLIDSSPIFAREINYFVEERKRSLHLAQGIENVSEQKTIEKGDLKLPHLLGQVINNEY